MVIKAEYALFVALILFNNVSSAHATDADTIRRAREEKTLVVYGAPEPNFMRPLIDKFTAAYPFVNATYLRAGSEKLLPRIQNEARAGKSLADVYCLRMAAMMLLRNEDLLARYIRGTSEPVSKIVRNR